MILEQRTYTLAPGNIDAYWQHYATLGAEVMAPVLPHLVGYFSSEIGRLNQIVHLWRYDSLAEREAKRGAMVANPDWRAHLGRIRPLTVAQETQIFRPSPVSHLSPLIRP